jgi:GTP-binding protein
MKKELDTEETLNRPVITIVGRPNVGKSTLYNRLTRSRDAIVDDQPGVTRDRMIGEGRIGSRPYWIVDTGGIEVEGTEIHDLMRRQVDYAIEESDAVLFIVDGREGLSTTDREIADQLRREDRVPVYLLLNKAEGLDKDVVRSDFFELGLGEPYPVSSKNGDGVRRLMDMALETVEAHTDFNLPSDVPRIAVVGRPNVGKSTLINRLTGEDRVVVYDSPGTTRDSIYVPFESDGEQYVLIDTAGMRKKRRIDDRLEHFSVIKTVQAIENAHVVLMVMDAQAGIFEQDLRLLSLILERGRSTLLLLNKWDNLSSYEKKRLRDMFDQKFRYSGNFEELPISALHGTGVGKILPMVRKIYDSALTDLGTGRLNRVLAAAAERQEPPMVGIRRIKIKYGHQGGKNPPHVVLHGNQLDKLPKTYKRYIASCIEDAYHMVGTRVRLSFKNSENPYENTSAGKTR